MIASGEGESAFFKDRWVNYTPVKGHTSENILTVPTALNELKRKDRGEHGSGSSLEVRIINILCMKFSKN